MRNLLKYIFNQYLSFSRSDRNALLVLSTLILIVLTAIIIVNNIKPQPILDSSGFKKIMDDWDPVNSNTDGPTQNFFHFNPNTISKNKLDSLSIPSFIKRNLLGYRNAGAKFYSANDLRKVYGMNDSIFNLIKPFIDIKKAIVPKSSSINVIEKKRIGYFDPNKTDLDELRGFGFNDFQAKNILSYRDKGGAFRNVNDLLKIYGVDSMFFETVKNHIQIEKQLNLSLLKNTDEPLNIELNSADSTNLVKLNGIGPVYAARIIKYRNLLGGYYSKKQLLEVYNFPDQTFLSIEKYISVDTLLINHIRINFVEYKALLRHPYLNKRQVEGLLNYREKNGPFKNVRAIREVEAINKETFSKIKPYFICR